MLILAHFEDDGTAGILLVVFNMHFLQQQTSCSAMAETA